MKKLFIRRTSFVFCFLILSFIPSFAQVKSYFGTTPDLKVSGKEFVDPNGRPVSLHGVMDTPNCYFNGGRWGWIDYNNPSTSNLNACKNYFTKVFEALTKKGGRGSSYCNLFRLHLDPAWLRNYNYTAPGFTNINDQAKTATDPNGHTVFDEANICHFSFDKMRTRMQDLYVPIIKDALAHGLYVVVRPPGVFPEDVKVGDYYNTYLTTVWDIVSSDSFVKANSGNIMLELGNEPVRMSGNLADYFQPIVNKIRQNGFNGIILLPGTSYQADYRNYNTKAISDNNFAYAVHNYPGWYGGWDANQSEANFISTFEAQVPIDKKPIIVTEVDWSPMKEGAGHWNETHTQYTEGNFGTWGTGTTDGAPYVPYRNTQNTGWGLRFRHLVDKHPNISFTLQGTTTYVDMDSYIKDGTVKPAFEDAMKAAGYPDARQACSGYCFDWYYELACGDRVPMMKGGDIEGGNLFDVVGNANYDSNNKHYCFYTTYYSSFIFHDFVGKKLIDCADFTMDCGTCTTGYRLDVQLKDSQGNIIKDGTNDYIIGSEEKGTRVKKEEASKVYNIQEIFADYIMNYPDCTIGDIRINTAIESDDANKQGLYYITINKMEMQISQIVARPATRTNLSDIKLMRYVDEQRHLVNDDAESGNKMGGWGGTIYHESSIGTINSYGYRLTNEKQNSWESQICYTNTYINGQQYYLKMNVKGSVAGKISAAFQKSEGYEGRGDFGEYNVTTGYTEWRVPCTVNGEGADRLLINYGGFPGTLYIDNVEIYTVEPKGTEITGKNIQLGSTVEGGAEVFGAGLLGNVAANEYADLTGFKQLTIKGTGGSLRVLYNRPSSGATPELNPSLETGSATIDLTQYPYFHLNSIKAGWGQTVNVTDIILSGDNSADEFADYYITGAGHVSQSAHDALADQGATCIDITGMTNKFPMVVQSANPNCLLIYASGKEDLMGGAFDARNVVKNDNSAWRIDLFDTHNFRNPLDKINCVGGASLACSKTDEWNTAVVPFAINAASCGAELYAFKAVDGGDARFEPVTTGTIEANTPFIYRNTGAKADRISSAGAVNLVKTTEGYHIQPFGISGWYTAQTYEEKTINVSTDGSLQNYYVYTILDGKLVRVTATLTIHPFTVIFLLDKNSTAATEMTIAVEGEGTIADLVRLINRKNNGENIPIDRISKIVNHILGK